MNSQKGVEGMTPNEINVAIAKELGWSAITIYGVGIPPNAVFRTCGIPDFHGSLDACAQFETTLSDAEKENYAWRIYNLTNGDLHDYEGDTNWDIVFQIATAKPPQRCEAFLRMKGKWI